MSPSLNANFNYLHKSGAQICHKATTSSASLSGESGDALLSKCRSTPARGGSARPWSSLPRKKYCSISNFSAAAAAPAAASGSASLLLLFFIGANRKSHNIIYCINVVPHASIVIIPIADDHHRHQLISEWFNGSLASLIPRYTRTLAHSHTSTPHTPHTMQICSGIIINLNINMDFLFGLVDMQSPGEESGPDPTRPASQIKPADSRTNRALLRFGLV